MANEVSAAIPVTPVSSKQEIEYPQFGMWVGFLYVIYFIALYVFATSFGSILHEYINRYISDPLEVEQVKRSLFGIFGDLSSVWLRSYLSALVIGYPVFAFLHLYLASLKKQRFEVVNIRARKIFIYITLIGSFWIGCYQLIKFVYTFLDGSISTRTLAHLAVTFSIVSIIFVYYLFQVGKDRT